MQPVDPDRGNARRQRRLRRPLDPARLIVSTDRRLQARHPAGPFHIHQRMRQRKPRQGEPAARGTRMRQCAASQR
ncbi:hypothetical protein PE067_09830 [Paracoccus sp. DMF-8]|uniref:hypothetical protein n=1 Tax=Paracoccus sp. DMF-8 TaxID=3019445 RepID=UPI0023E7FB89|nr:hypothetical protein [Paracoccus sp. DMF-8]MDF3606414.1 hypothetical protein [Paracoccus sp. DMF-8]